jgi:hypothetical protein
LTVLAALRASCTDDKVRDGPQAVALAARLCEAAGAKNPVSLRILAAAYAEAGKFPQAVETAEKALALINPPDAPSAEAIRLDLRLYREGKPLRLNASAAR